MATSSRNLYRGARDLRVGRIAVLLVAAASLCSASHAAENCRHEIVGRWGGECTAVAIDSTTAYTGIGAALLAVDISDPAQPVERWRMMLGGQVVQIQLAGNLLFAACDYAGLQIIDVSDPAHPSRVGEYNAENVYAVTLRGGLAYVLTDHLTVLDVSDPASPVLLGQGTDYGFQHEQIELVGEFALVSDYYEGLVVYDVSVPTAPQRVASFDINQANPSWAWKYAETGCTRPPGTPGC